MVSLTSYDSAWSRGRLRRPPGVAWGRTMVKRTSWHVHSVPGGCYNRPGGVQSGPSVFQRRFGCSDKILKHFLSIIKKQNYICKLPPRGTIEDQTRSRLIRTLVRAHAPAATARPSVAQSCPKMQEASIYTRTRENQKPRTKVAENVFISQKTRK